MGHRDHREKAASTPVRVAVLTVSDTRTESDDKSGSFIKSAVETAGHRVTNYKIEKDEPSRIAGIVTSLALAGAADVLLINGGTGISRRDSTFEAVESVMDRRISGFGELFRMLSHAEIGPAAMLSRAQAGIVGGMLVFSMPGSEAAVRLAVERLILPELKHMVWEMKR